MCEIHGSNGFHLYPSPPSCYSLKLQPTLTDVKLITSEEELPEDLHAPNLKLFVCSVNLDLQRKVVGAADTLTTSLGPVSN